jgi:hypothetical protein
LAAQRGPLRPNPWGGQNIPIQLLPTPVTPHSQPQPLASAPVRRPQAIVRPPARRNRPLVTVCSAAGSVSRPADRSVGWRRFAAPDARFTTPAARFPLQGFPPIATNPLGNTTISVAIGGYYCTETVIWLQFVCLLQHKI